MRNSYSIMCLDVEHVDEICNDIKSQYEMGIADCVLFMFKLVPEGNPLINKAKIQGEKYKVFKTKLDKMGLKSGILVQCSIGHGWTLDEPNNLVKYKNLTNGKEDANVVCPYSKQFHDYIRNQFSVIAQLEPYTVMVDDDYRLMFRPGKGCACKLHMKAFKQASGLSLGRRQLYKALQGGDKSVINAYVQTQRESLIEGAKAMREGLDAVNPLLFASFCCVGASTEFAWDIAKTLAGKDNEPVVRINNGRYVTPFAKNISEVSFRCADAGNRLRKNGIKYVLAETDTCPQNRYSTSATALHAHYVLSLLEGANGAKHWITRLASYEPDSGKAYRNILSKHRGFYEEIMSIVPSLSWHGCKIPLSKEIRYEFDRPTYYWRKNQWLINVLEVMGLPVYISDSQDGGACFLEGDLDEYFLDEEILQMLKGTLVVDGVCAKRLEERGFSKYVGVKVRKWTGATFSREIDKWGREFNAQPSYQELVLSGATEISTAYNLRNGTELQRLFPAVAEYKNELGGRVIVFCGKAEFNYGIGAPFSFLNESRKAQFVQILKQSGNLPMYCEGDGQVYVKYAITEKGDGWCMLLNTGFDVMDEIKIWSEKPIRNVKALRNNGEYCDCNFEKTESGAIVKEQLSVLMPQILIFEY
ncbi:MAG: hypothetical protein E7353_05965 [Clostridiales bacterium]|nr:hypothetical protein [Clostridiales bacterium]